MGVLFKVKNCDDKADFIRDYVLPEDVTMPEIVKKTQLSKALGEPRPIHKYLRRTKNRKTGKWEYTYEEKEQNPAKAEKFLPGGKTTEKPTESPKSPKTAIESIKKEITKEPKKTKYLEKFQDFKTGKWLYVYPWSKPKHYFNDILDQVLQQGGLKPYRNTDERKQQGKGRPEWEEFVRSVPFAYRRKNGKAPDEMADVLGFRRDDDLYNAMRAAQNARDEMIGAMGVPSDEDQARMKDSQENEQRQAKANKLKEIANQTDPTAPGWSPEELKLKVGDKVKINGSWTTVIQRDDETVTLANGTKMTIFPDSKLPIEGGKEQGVIRASEIKEGSQEAHEQETKEGK